MSATPVATASYAAAVPRGTTFFVINKIKLPISHAINEGEINPGGLTISLVTLFQRGCEPRLRLREWPS
jgi:hypothetical protein